MLAHHTEDILFSMQRSENDQTFKDALRNRECDQGRSKRTNLISNYKIVLIPLCCPFWGGTA